MLKELFKKTPETDIEVTAIKNQLINAYQLMQKKGYNLLTIQCEEDLEPNKLQGGWKEIDPYYPSSMLSDNEVALMKQEKNYFTLNIRANDIPKVRNYNVKPAVEIMKRRRIHPFLPQTTFDCITNYQTDEYIFNLIEEDLEFTQFIKDNVKKGNITKEGIAQQIAQGLKNHREITEREYERAGVYASLEKIANEPPDRVLNFIAKAAQYHN